jgi:hypothetical protein
MPNYNIVRHDRVKINCERQNCKAIIIDPSDDKWVSKVQN